MFPDQGTLGETAQAKLLLAYYEQNKTGILYFRQNETLKVFYLNRGKISWAISSDEADKIEHILLAKKMVSPELFSPYQAGNKITESFGKILVENGVLSLEGLITATREQVRQIAASVLHWSTGNYQLVQESPPTRLVSLDLEIPGLVNDYVLSQMDVNIAWEELGSLSGELEQTSLPGKKNLYPLDIEQQEVFSRFQQPQRLEKVLLDFPAERKYRILKILYFFLLSGLLSKNEAEKAPSLNFNELDSLFGQDLPAAQAKADLEMPAMINEAEIKDIPLSELPDISVLEDGESVKELLPELPDLNPPEIAEAREEIKDIPAAAVVEKTLLRTQLLLKPEKQKSRWMSVTFLSILLAAVAFGAFLWLTRAPETQVPAVARPASARAEQKKPLPQNPVPIGTQAGPQTVAEQPQPAAAQAQPRVNAAAKTVPGSEPAPGDPAAEKTKAQNENKPLANTVATAAQAQKYFASGNFFRAGDLWRQELITSRISYSILLEMDCLKASVRLAYDRATDKEKFFVLNKTSRDGRRCWLALCGRYRTQEEAALGMKLIPQYFWKQSEPPSVVELGPYL